jgi:hypothetical protein
MEKNKKQMRTSVGYRVLYSYMYNATNRSQRKSVSIVLVVSWAE